MPFQAPNPPSGSSFFAAWCRKVQNALRAIRILPGLGYKVKYTTNGTILEIDPVMGGSGWRWASIPEYDAGTAYGVNRVVVVSSDNTSGAAAGTWVCVKSALAGTLPVAPPEPPTDPATGLWVAGVHWVPVGGGASAGFYPFKVYLSPIIAPLPGTATLGSTYLTLTTSDAGVIAQITTAINDVGDGPTTITGAGIASGTTLVSTIDSVNPVVVLSQPTTAVVNSAVTISPPNAWRSFRVRAGCVGMDDVQHTDGDGTDSNDLSPNYDPDHAGVPSYMANVDFLMGTDHLVGVWVDRSDPDNPVIAHGYIQDDWTPSTDSGYTPGGPTAWWTEQWILLAVIDARLVDGIDPGPGVLKIARVRQFRREDIPMVSGCVNGDTATVPV